MAQRNFVAWTYTADDTTTFTRRADSRMTAQQGDNAPLGAVGGAAASGSTVGREMPRNLKPRYAIVKETGQPFQANVVIYTAAALAALTIGTTTFEVYDAGGTGHTCVVKAKVPQANQRIIGA